MENVAELQDKHYLCKLQQSVCLAYVHLKTKDNMPQQQSQSNIQNKIEIKEPGQWAVVFWNDDFTTMDFVVQVLREVFLKSEDEAQRLMMKVHQENCAVVGVYTYDVAVSRRDLATAKARQAGFPLEITCREV